MDKYLEEAIAEYEQNIESGHTFYMDAPILMDIEEYYEKNGRPYDAERIMRFAEKLHPDSEDVLVVKAYRLKSAGKWQQACDILQRIPNQENRDVQLFYVEWDVAMARIDQAEKRFEKNYALAAPPENEDWLYDFGEILIDYGYNERGLKYLDRISANYSMRQRVDELVGDALCQLGKYTESVKSFSKLVDADPYDSVSWTQLADVQYKAKAYEDCMESCDYALAIDDTNARAKLFKLYSLFAMRRFEQAMSLYGEYVNKGNEDYAMHMLVGEELNVQGRYAESRKPLQEALRLCPIDNPDRTRVVSALVEVFIAYGKKDEARELMMTLVSGGSQPVDLYMQLASSFYDFHNEAATVEMLGYVMLLPERTEKDVLGIVQFLVKNSLYVPAAKLWKQMVALRLSDDSLAYYTYVVYAMAELKSYPYLVYAFQRAASRTPQALCEVFFTAYGARTVGELWESLQRDAEQWESYTDVSPTFSDGQ